MVSPRRPPADGDDSVSEKQDAGAWGGERGGPDLGDRRMGDEPLAPLDHDQRLMAGSWQILQILNAKP